MSKWSIINQKYIEKNQWVSLRKDKCRTETGKEIEEYYVLEIQDVSCVIAATKENKFLFIKEYKHGVQKEILQLPCGYIEKDEQPLDAAQRELLEETGYASKKWKSLGKFAGSPGRLTHYYHFFLAEDCEKVQEPMLDELETAYVLEYTKKEVEEQLKKQETDIISKLGFLMIKEKI